MADPSSGYPENTPDNSAGPPVGSAVATPNIFLHSYCFNQDQSCFACGTTAGFRIFSLLPAVKEVHRIERAGVFKNRSVQMVSMLFKTSTCAMVSLADDDSSGAGLTKIQIYDMKSHRFVGEVRSRNETKAICFRRDVLVMVCEYAIYVYAFPKIQLDKDITTKSNPLGLCALATASDPWILCCPAESTGCVRVQVGKDVQREIAAHQTALAAIALNKSGTLVATASEVGTVAKVFQTSDGQELYRLRRSATPTTISCLVFRDDDKFVAMASSTSTVHLFKLDSSLASSDGDQMGHQRSEDFKGNGSSDAGGTATLTSMMAGAVLNVATAVAGEVVTDAVKGVMPAYFSDLRSYATFRIPEVDLDGQASVDVRSKQSQICGAQLAFKKDENRILVLHYSGMLYEATFRPDADSTAGTQVCGLHCATPWFGIRPDFKLQGAPTNLPTVAGGATEDEEDADPWQLL